LLPALFVEPAALIGAGARPGSHPGFPSPAFLVPALFVEPVLLTGTAQFLGPARRSSCRSIFALIV
jgi:hypothetical protein